MDVARDCVLKELQQGKACQLDLKSFDIKFTAAATELSQPGLRFHQRALFFMQTPFRFHCSVDKVDERLMCFAYVVVNLRNGGVVATASSCHFVNVSVKNAFLLQCGAALRTKVFSGSECLEPLYAERASTPETCYSSNALISYFDTNADGQVTSVAYLDMCLNCADEAVRSKFLRNYQGTICKHAVKRAAFHMLLQGSRCGDAVDIAMWEDQKNPYCLFFDLQPLCNQKVCRVILEFFPSNPDAHL